MWDLLCKYNEFIEISYSQHTQYILDSIYIFFFSHKMCLVFACSKFKFVFVSEFNSKAFGKEMHWIWYTPCNPCLKPMYQYIMYSILWQYHYYSIIKYFIYWVWGKKICLAFGFDTFRLQWSYISHHQYKYMCGWELCLTDL